MTRYMTCQPVTVTYTPPFAVAQPLSTLCVQEPAHPPEEAAAGTEEKAYSPSLRSPSMRSSPSPSPPMRSYSPTESEIQAEMARMEAQKQLKKQHKKKEEKAKVAKPVKPKKDRRRIDYPLFSTTLHVATTIAVVTNLEPANK